MIEISTGALIFLALADFFLGFGAGVALWLIDLHAERRGRPRPPSPPWGGT